MFLQETGDRADHVRRSVGNCSIRTGQGQLARATPDGRAVTMENPGNSRISGIDHGMSQGFRRGGLSATGIDPEALQVAVGDTNHLLLLEIFHAT